MYADSVDRRFCRICKLKPADRSGLEDFIASADLTIDEIAKLSYDPKTKKQMAAWEIQYHRDNCMDRKFKGVEKRTGEPAPESALQRSDRLYEKLERVFDVAAERASAAEKVTKENTEPVVDMATAMMNVNQFRAVVTGEMPQQHKGNGAQPININAGIVLPTVHGKTEAEVQNMVANGVPMPELPAPADAQP